MVVPLINLRRPAPSDAQQIEVFKQALLRADQLSISRNMDWTPPDFVIYGASLLTDFRTTIIDSDHPSQPREATGNIWTAIKPYVIPRFFQPNNPNPYQQIVGYSERIEERYLAVWESINEHCDAVQSFIDGMHSIDAALNKDIND